MKYKAGDRVRIVNKKVGGNWTPGGEMEEWLDEIMTVKFAAINCEYYTMEEDNGMWAWKDYMIAGLADEPQSKMAEVAKLLAKQLDVELEEEFEVPRYFFNPCKITSDGVADCDEDLDDGLLGKLLRGKLEIKKLPWKPKDGDEYYYVCVDGEIASDGFFPRCTTDYTLGLIGNCFKTKAEAEANKEAVKEKFGLDEWVK